MLSVLRRWRVHLAQRARSIAVYAHVAGANTASPTSPTSTSQPATALPGASAVLSCCPLSDKFRNTHIKHASRLLATPGSLRVVCGAEGGSLGMGGLGCGLWARAAVALCVLAALASPQPVSSGNATAPGPTAKKHHSLFEPPIVRRAFEVGLSDRFFHGAAAACRYFGQNLRRAHLQAMHIQCGIRSSRHGPDESECILPFKYTAPGPRRTRGDVLHVQAGRRAGHVLRPGPRAARVPARQPQLPLLVPARERRTTVRH